MHLSLQLWTVRDPLNADPAGTLAALGKMGYRYVETAGFAGKTPAEFFKMMRDAGLRASGMHVGLDACEKELNKVIDDAELFETKYVIVPWIGEAVYKAGWDQAGIRLQKVGEKVASKGKTFAYHNHAFEFAPWKGRPGYESLLESACPDFVKAEIDLWWAYVGNEDPAAILKRHAARTPLLHLKDGKSKDAQVNAEAGQGVLEWDGILAEAKKAKVEFGVIELDNCPRPPLESVKMCLEYFQAKGYR